MARSTNTAPLGFVELTTFARTHNLNHERAKRLLSALDRELHGMLGPVLLQVGRTVYVKADVTEHLSKSRDLGLPQLAREVFKNRRRTKSRFATLEARVDELETRIENLILLMQTTTVADTSVPPRTAA